MKPRPRARGWDQAMQLGVPAVVSLAALGLYLATTARTITWSHGGADGAELSAAAATLGVAHPTGYPLYLLLAWLFTLVPAGEVAFRVALLSVVCAAIAAGMAAHVVAAISSRQSALGTQHPPLRGLEWRALLGPAAAGFGLALSSLFWSQATIPEVYSLHALLVLLLVAATARWRRGDDRSFVVMALLAGIGLGNHLTLALLLAPVALYLLVEDPGVLRRRALPMAVAAFLAGLSIYLYIPIRAAASPALNWGNPVDPASFLSHIAATSYYGYIGNRPTADALARVPVMARLMGEQLTWPGLALSILGLSEMLCRRRRLTLALLGYLLLTLLFTLFYNADNGQVYLIPATVVLALGLGIGVASLATGRVGAYLALATLAVLTPVAAVEQPPLHGSQFGSRGCPVRARSPELGTIRRSAGHGARRADLCPLVCADRGWVATRCRRSGPQACRSRMVPGPDSP